MSIKTVGDLRSLLEKTLNEMKELPDDLVIGSSNITPEEGYSDGCEGSYIQDLSVSAGSGEEPGSFEAHLWLTVE